MAPSKYKDFPALQTDIVHSSLLEEFIFWTFKYEFPQNFVCFLLNMLPDPEYKVICYLIQLQGGIGIALTHFNVFSIYIQRDKTVLIQAWRVVFIS